VYWDQSSGLTPDTFFELVPKPVYVADLHVELTSDIGVMSLQSENLPTATDIDLDPDHYYYLDVQGSVESDYMKVGIYLDTVHSGKRQQRYTIGISSVNNLIRIDEPYDEVQFRIFYMGVGSIEVNSIAVYEVSDFKTIPLESIEYGDLSLVQRKGTANHDITDLLLEDVPDTLAQVAADEWVSPVNHQLMSPGELFDLGNDPQDRTYDLYVHGFSTCQSYLNLFAETGAPEVLLSYYSLVETWLDSFPYVSTANGLAYNDFATSNRVYNFMAFYDVAKDYLSDDQRQRLMTSIIFQANLLNEDHFNSRGTNHGLYMDMTYLAFLNYVHSPLINASSGIEATAANMERYFILSVTEEGIHAEHSPSYHVNMVPTLTEVIGVLDRLEVDTSALTHRREMMIDYQTFLAKPDYVFPELGDTAAHFRSSYVPDPTNQSGDLAMDPLIPCQYDSELPTDMVYPLSGYAIFRDDWAKCQDTTYVLFYNAYHSFFHKHSDENGVWIYRDGDIVREAGFNGYTYDDPHTKHAYSSWGHNSLIVNDTGLVEDKNVPNDYNYAGTYIDSFDVSDSQLVSITGVNARYKGVVQRRSLTWDKTADIVEVVDAVSSNTENTYTFLWQLAADITPIIEGDQISLFRDEALVMNVFLDSTQPFEISIVYGQLEPRVLGWYSDGVNNPLPTHTIVVDLAMSSDAVLTTSFVFAN